jgi:hydrogenase nickel incorporation protein HypB
MCDSCGCNVTSGNEYLVRAGGKLEKTEHGRETVNVLKGLLTENDHQAAHNREHFDRRGILTINLMSSPGAGKTTLLEVTIDALKDQYSIGVIEGDLETENDAQRIRARGVEAIQITTGNACHLDAHMVHNALHQLKLDGLDILFIENVGNLVCPASFDLGQHRNATLLSVPEGDDKPAKYPVMFRTADIVLLTKTDLLPLLDDFQPPRVERYLRELASQAPIMEVSAGKTVNLNNWLDWLETEIVAHQDRVKRGERIRPALRAEDIHRHTDAFDHVHEHTQAHPHASQFHLK